MDTGYEAHLALGEVTFDQGDAALLCAIEAEGSLNAAATTLGRSYSRVQKRVVALEDAVGPLVDRRRGGAAGGGSSLTDRARSLLAKFDRLRAALAETAGSETVTFSGTVVDQSGEVATVDTDAGRLRALLFENVEWVDVTFDANTVTLSVTGDAAPPDRSSALNRLRGTVTALEVGAAIATVRVDVGAPTSVVAVVTVESVARLGLAPGEAVVATFKATATRATPTVSAGSDIPQAPDGN